MTDQEILKLEMSDMVRAEEKATRIERTMRQVVVFLIGFSLSTLSSASPPLLQG
jgi:hypothetical protein